MASSPPGIYARLKTDMKNAYYTDNMVENLANFRTMASAYLSGPGEYEDLPFLKICENLEGNGIISWKNLHYLKNIVKSASTGEVQILEMIDEAEREIQESLSDPGCSFRRESGAQKLKVKDPGCPFSRESDAKKQKVKDPGCPLPRESDAKKRKVKDPGCSFRRESGAQKLKVKDPGCHLPRESDAKKRKVKESTQTEDKPGTSVSYTSDIQAKGRKDALHKAYLDPRNMNQYQYCTMPQPTASQRIGIIPGTISGTTKPIVTAGERVLTTSTPRSSFAEMPVQTSDSGLFSDSSMLLFAKHLSLNEMWELSVYLHIPSTTYANLQTKHRDNPTELKLRIIKEWLDKMTCSEEELASNLCVALEMASLLGMKNTVESVLKENRAFKITDFRK